MNVLTDSGIAMKRARLIAPSAPIRSSRDVPIADSVTGVAHASGGMLEATSVQPTITRLRQYDAWVASMAQSASQRQCISFTSRGLRFVIAQFCIIIGGNAGCLPAPKLPLASGSNWPVSDLGHHLAMLPLPALLHLGGDLAASQFEGQTRVG